MKRCILLLFVIPVFTSRVHGQQSPPPPPPPPSFKEVIADEDSNGIFESVALEEQPEYPGGMPALYTYLQKNIKYPQSAKDNGIQGKVFVSFVIEKNGSITNVKVLKGINGAPECDSEAVRVIRMMPDWTPGKLNGKPVRAKYTIPIKFSISGMEENPTFPGGQSAMQLYFSENLQYPKVASRRKTGGTVLVSFEVDPTGKVTNTKVLKGIGSGCDEEALRLVNNMPNWKPGAGQKKNYSAFTPVYFKLPEKK